MSEATVIPKVAKACGVMMDWSSTLLAAVMCASLTRCLCDVGSEGNRYRSGARGKGEVCQWVMNGATARDTSGGYG